MFFDLNLSIVCPETIPKPMSVFKKVSTSVINVQKRSVQIHVVHAFFEC